MSESEPDLTPPTPTVDDEPETKANPGGPDAVERDPDRLSGTTRDQPKAAQVEAGTMPEEITEPEAQDAETDDDSPSEPSA